LGRGSGRANGVSIDCYSMPEVIERYRKKLVWVRRVESANVKI